MSRTREIGYTLVVCLTAASTLLGAFPVAAFTCCCKASSEVVAGSRQEPGTTEPLHPCCKAKSSAVPCGDADACCQCSCCMRSPAPVENPARSSGFGLCPCSTQPEPQSSDPTTAHGLIGSDFELSLASSLLAVLPTFDLPSVGGIASCGISPTICSPQSVDLLTILSRLTC
jgi:hypothetical protein